MYLIQLMSVDLLVSSLYQVPDFWMTREVYARRESTLGLQLGQNVAAIWPQ